MSVGAAGTREWSDWGDKVKNFSVLITDEVQGDVADQVLSPPLLLFQISSSQSELEFASYGVPCNVPAFREEEII